MRGDVLDGLIAVPWVFAQFGSIGPGSGGSGTTPPPTSLLALALRRWFASLTLSPPGINAGAVPEAIWVTLGALGFLLLVVIVAQGPRRALGQLVDLRGHLQLWEAAVGRVRRSVRLLIVVVGVSVVSWTGGQALRYADLSARDDLALLLNDRRVVDVAWAQGALAALTPIRDVVGLGMMYLMLAGATFVLFQYSTFRWSPIRPAPEIRARVTFWATVGWGSTAFYAIDRFVGLVATGQSDRPYGGCFGLGAFLVPALMALADGVMVAWVLVELRHGGTQASGGGTEETDRLDLTGVVLALPAAMIGCVLTMPARYIATGVALGSESLPVSILTKPDFAAFIRWELSWGLMVWQAVGLLFVGWLGVAAWSRGKRWETIRGFGRLLAQNGGRVVVVLALAVLVAGVLSGLAYALILALPGAPWVLAAADSYAHYATIPVGLITLAALVELAGRSVAPVEPVGKAVTDDWADLGA